MRARPFLSYIFCLCSMPLAWAVTGCAKEEIHSYNVPKDPPPGRTVAETPSPHPPMGPAAASSASGQEGRMVWTVPEGWREVPGQKQMREATFEAGQGDAAVEIVVSSFPGAAGGLLPNVNRWRGQINLEPLAEADLDESLETFRTDLVVGHLLDMTGGSGEGGQRLIGAIIDAAGQRTWFVKALGAPEVLEPHAAAIAAFSRSFRLEGPAPVAAGAAPSAGGGGAAAGATWQAPPHWVRDTTESMIVSAAWQVTNEAGEARATVTSLSGTGGGALPNINRWRGQVGLPPVASLAEQPQSPVAGRPGSAAAIIDLLATEAGPEGRPRILVAMLPHQGRTWFVKMTGMEAVLEPERATFESLVQFVDSTGMSP